MRRQLEETGEEKKSLQSQLEQRTHEEMKTKDLLEEKEMEIHLLKQVTLIIMCACVCVCERQSFCGENWLQTLITFKTEMWVTDHTKVIFPAS